MNILRPAIEALALDSAIWNDVGGRFYYQSAGSPDYPRVVFSRISGVPDNVFVKKGESVLIQFDLYSAKSAGITQIETMETDLMALFDDCSLDLAGNTLYGFTRQNTISIEEEVDALPDGTTTVVHIAIDYEANYQAT